MTDAGRRFRVGYLYTGGQGRVDVDAADHWRAARAAADHLGWLGDGRIMRVPGGGSDPRFYTQRRRDGWLVECVVAELDR